MGPGRVAEEARGAPAELERLSEEGSVLGVGLVEPGLLELFTEVAPCRQFQERVEVGGGQRHAAGPGGRTRPEARDVGLRKPG